jgi:glycosyltransferase involved in cell wall biosynthesis
MGVAKRIWAFLKFMLLATWHSASTPADVVFATSTPLTVVVPGAISAWVRRVPWILEVRDLWPEIPIAIGALTNPFAIRLARAIEKVGYRSAAHIVALSPDMGTGIVASGTPANKVTVIPNFSDLDRFGGEIVDPELFLASRPELRGAQIVMYAGTIGLVNGVPYLADIAAEARAANSHAVFSVSGEGAERAALIGRAANLGVLGHNFFVYNQVPKREIPSALAAATVCMSVVIDLPELRANSANKFFDGLAAGRPMAINHEGWQADVLRESGAGIVLPTSDAANAWRLLEALLGSPTRLSTMGQQARRLAQDRFDKRALTAQLAAVLVSVGTQPRP